MRRLRLLEEQGRVREGRTILVIPAVNPYSINSEKRFWPSDNTDINRMFPGYDLGETTQRVAASLFEVLDGFEYGIHLTSHYISGNFLPHVSIQNTGREYTESAKAFGLAYVRYRIPTHYDTTTLNYNWQIWNTKGIVEFDHHRGYISSVITDDDIIVIKSAEAGFFDCKVRVGEFVRKGKKIARILDTGSGELVVDITAPEDGIIFFIQSNPLAFANSQLMLMIR